MKGFFSNDWARLLGLLYGLLFLPLSQLQAIDYGTDPTTPMRLKTDVGYENMVVIQTISTSRQSFVVRKGARHGISKHQRALFSTEQVSLLCKAIEVTHEFTLWEVEDPLASVPFTKDQMVVFSTSLETIWTKVPALRGKLQQFMLTKDIVPPPYFLVRGGMSRGLSESVSDTGASSTIERGGYHFEALYYFNFAKQLDMGFGGRFDQESALIDQSDLSVPTTRLFVIGQLTYRFPELRGTRNYFYLTAGVGYGTSTTTINDATSAGTAYVLPSFHFGLMTLGEKYGFAVELVGEAVGQQEQFLDGTTQNTNMINAKFSAALRF
jgi:hypothetical protein